MGFKSNFFNGKKYMLHLLICVACSKFVLMKSKFEVDCVEFKLGEFSVNRCKGIKDFDEVCGNCTISYDVR